MKSFVAEDSFWELFPQAAVGVVVVKGMKPAAQIPQEDVDAIATLQPSAFDAIYSGLSVELAAMRPVSDTADRQHVILWQQLSMIVHQLPACFHALRNEQEAVV